MLSSAVDDGAVQVAVGDGAADAVPAQRVGEFESDAARAFPD
ncbi:hypothetical protein [Streptomyces sp. IB2014 016-6]|nr:hypothetical protein [Streptomyces sp. IB2014 016-6]